MRTPTILLSAFLTLTAATADAQTPPARNVKLDEVLKAARDYNRDLRAAREHLVQVGADIDRAWAALLPTAVVQGKYTFNYPEIVVNFIGQSSTLQANVSKASGTATAEAIKDLYAKVAQAPSQAVFDAQKAVQSATDALTAYCSDPTNKKNDFGCGGGEPITILPQNQLDLNISANVPLVIPWAWYQLRAARQGVIAQERGYDAQESGILLQVAGAFFAAAGTDEVVVARRHGIEVSQKTLHDAEVRFQAGVVNKVDVLRAKVALLRAEQALRESLDSEASAYRALRTLTGIDEPIRAIPEAEPPVVEGGTDALVEDARRLRPELRAIDSQIEAAKAGATSNLMRWVPTLSAFGLARFFNYGGFAGKNYAFAAGLQLDWIVYDGGIRQAGQKQFESAAREARIRKELLTEQIADDVKNLRAQLDTKRTGLAEAREEQKLAEETLNLVRVQREAGTATQLDLLTAQDQLILTELNVARQRFDLGLTHLQLLRATGTFR